MTETPITRIRRAIATALYRLAAWVDVPWQYTPIHSSMADRNLLSYLVRSRALVAEALIGGPEIVEARLQNTPAETAEWLSQQGERPAETGATHTVVSECAGKWAEGRWSRGAGSCR